MNSTNKNKMRHGQKVVFVFVHIDFHGKMGDMANKIIN